MDLDINKMFLKKNGEIFINSLTLEMERNLESLKNTTDNTVALEINKLYIFFKKFFTEINKNYKKEELLGALFFERKKYNDIVNSFIEEKKNNIKNDFLNNIEDVITEEFLDKYYEKLKEESNLIIEKIELELKKEITLNFVPKIIKKFQLEGDECERVTRRINGLFTSTLLSRIEEEINFRDESLSNVSRESYKKYLELNKETTNN